MNNIVNGFWNLLLKKLKKKSITGLDVKDKLYGFLQPICIIEKLMLQTINIIYEKTLGKGILRYYRQLYTSKIGIHVVINEIYYLFKNGLTNEQKTVLSIIKFNLKYTMDNVNYMSFIKQIEKIPYAIQRKHQLILIEGPYNGGKVCIYKCSMIEDTIIVVPNGNGDAYITDMPKENTEDYEYVTHNIKEVFNNEDIYDVKTSRYCEYCKKHAYIYDHTKINTKHFRTLFPRNPQCGNCKEKLTNVRLWGICLCMNVLECIKCANLIPRLPQSYSGPILKKRKIINKN